MNAVLPISRVLLSGCAGSHPPVLMRATLLPLPVVPPLFSLSAPTHRPSLRCTAQADHSVPLRSPPATSFTKGRISGARGANGERVCLDCNGSGVVSCVPCKGKGTLARGGYQRRTPLNVKHLNGSKWTAMSDTFGWRHFVVKQVKKEGGAPYALLEASCDANVQFWVAKDNLRDRSQWAAGWLEMKEIDGLGDAAAEGTGTPCRRCESTGFVPCETCEGKGILAPPPAIIDI
jgi:tryptophan-rich hypothetical protein